MMKLISIFPKSLVKRIHCHWDYRHKVSRLFHLFALRFQVEAHDKDQTF